MKEQGDLNPQEIESKKHLTTDQGVLHIQTTGENIAHVFVPKMVKNGYNYGFRVQIEY